MLALARRLTDLSEDTEHSLEALFAHRSAAEAEGAEYLAGEDGFAATAEPGPYGPASSDADLCDWKQDDQAPTLIGAAEVAGVAAATERINLCELALLKRRPRPRRKAAPAEQLKLFGDQDE
jgi:hypothetical protein